MSTLVGKKAPDFTSSAVLPDGEIINNFNLTNYIANKKALIFFYPFDFTFVCPTELLALHNRMEFFKERKIEVIAVSIDSEHTHKAWRETEISKGGIGNVDFNMVADVKHEIVKSYGVEHPDIGAAFRASFLVDKNGIIRSQIINDLPIGRNIDEIIRTFDAIEFNDKYGEVCPVGWQKGDKGLQTNNESIAKFLQEQFDKI
jgi:peroxiredoxin (alkyl hydroperoxide reductase subunit C)